MYTTPSSTTGLAANVPYPPTLAVALPLRSKDHALCRCVTFARSIVEVVASRVLARSPLGYGHEAGAVAAVLGATVSEIEARRAPVATPHRRCRFIEPTFTR